MVRYLNVQRRYAQNSYRRYRTMQRVRPQSYLSIFDVNEFVMCLRDLLSNFFRSVVYRGGMLIGVRKSLGALL